MITVVIGVGGSADGGLITASTGTNAGDPLARIESLQPNPNPHSENGLDKPAADLTALERLC
ncbi:hypothetical protein [Mycobacterium lentiflavum]|uniref:hypothetical protein n=1 Tax=Mycobacterium lentiflavum TaxID=141349 RepID=UPI0015866248|nr:hypothetical protein [Mycobacterium lentiflavum]